MLWQGGTPASRYAAPVALGVIAALTGCGQVLVGATGETIMVEGGHVVDLLLPNPLYEPYGAIDSLIPVDEQASVGDDVLFSKRDKTITLSASSDLEVALLKQYERM